MTKIIFQTVLTFWVVTLETNAQRLVTADYVVTYEFTSTSDTTLGTFAPKTDFILRGLGNESHFHSANRQFNDSMNHVYFLTHPPTSSIKKSKDKEAARSNYMGYMSQWFKSTVVDYKVQKQFNDGIIKVNQHHAFPYRHLEISTPLPWKISPIRDTIKGLFCQKATLEYGGRMYSAWFAPGIPIYDGPYIFSGLPGLIVSVSDKRNWYNFEIKEVQRNVSAVAWRDRYLNPFSKAVSRKSFVDHQRRKKNNPKLAGVVEDDESNEELLTAKNRYAWRYFLLIEDY